VPGTAGLHDTLDEVSGHMPFIGDGSVGIDVDGDARMGFPTPSRKLELWSDTLADWGWPEHATPGWIPSHVHWQDLDLDGAERILLPTFRIPTLIHTRSGNSKWLNEISHRHPLWLHPADAEALGIEVGELVRVNTRIGHFVIQTWRTEGIRPGVVACSHHMGRWRLDPELGNERWSSGVAGLDHDGDRWQLRPRTGVAPFGSSDPDSARVWWTDAGVHQNLTFPVQPDPISGMHCWLQRVTITPAQEGDRHGDVHVDTAKSTEAFEEWLAMTRPGPGPGDLRRPLWFARPVKPLAAAYRFGGDRSEG
jgi:anaerobic selenocysteine-containing dehydrogenase